MDADTRHQLKQNALAELLTSLKDLNDPKWRYGLTALLVVLLAILGWKGWRYTQQRSLEQGWQRLTDIRSRFGDDETGAAADLQTFVRETSQPTLAAAARIFLARARTDYAFKNAAEQQSALNEAADLYQQAASDPRTPGSLAAEAQFGLATTYESLREFDKAAEAYKTLIDNPTRFAGSPYLALAKQRFGTLNTLRTPIAFQPGMPPAASQPATSPASAPVTVTPAESPAASQPAAQPPVESQPETPQ